MKLDTLNSPSKRLDSAGRIVIPFEILDRYLMALLSIGVATGAMFVIGRGILGEGVIALLYLASISWVAARWGQGPGILAAFASALAFDFLFMAPFLTLNIASLEGWLMLAIFLMVAVVIVGRIQISLRQAQAREHEAVVMYEFGSLLAVAPTRAAISRALGEVVQQYYQARLVQVVCQGAGAAGIVASFPSGVRIDKKPDLIAPLLSAKELIGEIRIWEGNIELPPQEDRLLHSLTSQSALALERASCFSYGGDE